MAQAVMIGRIATGEAEEEYVDKDRSSAGRKGGDARAGSLSPERRREIAKKDAKARWG